MTRTRWGGGVFASTACLRRWTKYKYLGRGGRPTSEYWTRSGVLFWPFRLFLKPDCTKIDNNQDKTSCVLPVSFQMFLTPDALFILVVDMFAYSDLNSREDALEQWLDILQSRVPGSVVLVVGTHRDCFASSTMCSERTNSFKRGPSHRCVQVGWPFWEIRAKT